MTEAPGVTGGRTPGGKEIGLNGARRGAAAREIAAAAGQSNRFLDRPVKAIDSDSGIGADLTELRRTVEDLDPSRHGKLTSRKKLFGIIPFGNKLRNYFDGYKSAQSHI